MPELRRAAFMSALLCIAGSPAWAQKINSSDGAITVRYPAHTVVLSRSDLSSLPRQTTRIVDGADTSSVSGVSLWDVLQKAGTPSAEASGRQRAVMYIRLTGVDGASAVVALVDVDPGFSHRSVLLADRRGDRPLDDAEGPWRAIFPDDARRARWIRGLVSIAVETVK